MHNFPHRQSFARYFLKKNNIIIRDLKKKIYFDYDNPPMPEEPLNHFLSEYSMPKLITGSVEKSNVIKRIYYYQDLRRMGFIINSYRARIKTFSGQKVIYKIEPIDTEGENTAKLIPQKHEIKYDVLNEALRLDGDNAERRWIYVHRKKKQIAERINLSSTEKAKLLFGEKSKEDSDKIIDIKGIPIGVSKEHHKLVCIPPWKDSPVCGFVGRRGRSKSIGAHMLIDFQHHMGAACGILHDYKYETYPFCLPTEGADFVNRLNLLHLNPVPLPIVYFAPDNAQRNRTIKNLEGRDENISHLISLSFEEAMLNYNSMFSGFKEFDLGKSKTVLPKDIYKCEYEEQAMAMVNPSTRPKEDRQMYGKLSRTLNFLFENEICDINTKSPSRFIVERLGTDGKMISKTEPLHPIIASMIAGLIPVFLPRSLQTIQFGKDSILPSYMNRLVQSIYDTKDQTRYFEGREIFLTIDEIGELIRKGGMDSIISIATMGRTSGIGLNWINQSYVNIPHEIRTNTTYLFCMQFNNQDEINKIVRNYDAPVSIGEEIKDLSKEIPHECFVFPSERLLLYDLSTGEEEYSDEPIKIQLTPTLSKHARKGLMG